MFWSLGSRLWTDSEFSTLGSGRSTLGPWVLSEVVPHLCPEPGKGHGCFLSQLSLRSACWVQLATEIYPMRPPFTSHHFRQFRQRGRKHRERSWPACLRMSIWAKAGHSRQQPAKGTDPRPIGQAHRQPSMEALGLVTPHFLSKGDTFISFVPYHTATE